METSSSRAGRDPLTCSSQDFQKGVLVSFLWLHCLQTVPVLLTLMCRDVEIIPTAFEQTLSESLHFILKKLIFFYFLYVLQIAELRWASVCERRHKVWKVQAGGVGWSGSAVAFGGRRRPRMCPRLLFCVSASPGWHRWHRHFPAGFSCSPQRPPLVFREASLSVFSSPGQAPALAGADPGLSEPNNPRGASQTALEANRPLVLTCCQHCRNWYPSATEV